MKPWKRVLAAALFALPLIGYATLGSAQETVVAEAAVAEVAAEAAPAEAGISQELFTVNNTWMVSVLAATPFWAIGR